MATAAAQQPIPLMRRSLEEAAALGAGLLKAFEREVADTQLLLVPQVRNPVLNAARSCQQLSLLLLIWLAKVPAMQACLL